MWRDTAPKLLDDLRVWLGSWPRGRKKAAFALFDLATLFAAAWLSFAIRLGSLFVPSAEQLFLIAAAPLITFAVFVRMGLYRAVLRYLTERAIWIIAQAVTIATLIWVAVAFLTQLTGAEGMPRSIPLVFGMLSGIITIGSRFGARWLLRGGSVEDANARRTLIYGSGDAAMQLAHALRATEGHSVVGFVSEDPNFHGMNLLGVRVYTPLELTAAIANVGVEEIIVATPAADEKLRRDLLSKIGNLPVRIRILPPIADMVSGKLLVSRVRDIDIDDLLRRPQVPADAQLLRKSVEHRVILISGAAGSIGSAVARTVAALGPAKMVLLEFSEHGLYEIGREIRDAVEFPVVSILGSITDERLVAKALADHAVDTIYHCAAYKHVPIVEQNVLEGVRNNVFGTRVLVSAAARSKSVRNFILISSDKAVHPSSIMGATKRWSELIVRHFGAAAKGRKARNFASVRFGNVIGSSGSVVPLFKEQIARGGPVTITDEKMTRYFMSVSEAAELIVQASTLSESGDILLLDMGDPVPIRHLAEDMIMLAGLTVRGPDNPHGQIEIVAIGMRDGEKLSEELFYDPESVSRTEHPKILRGKRNGFDYDIPAMLDDLAGALERGDEQAVRAIVFDRLKAKARPQG